MRIWWKALHSIFLASPMKSMSSKNMRCKILEYLVTMQLAIVPNALVSLIPLLNPSNMTKRNRSGYSTHLCRSILVTLNFFVESPLLRTSRFTEEMHVMIHFISLQSNPILCRFNPRNSQSMLLYALIKLILIRHTSIIRD